jgi:hypothetical protein
MDGRKDIETTIEKHSHNSGFSCRSRYSAIRRGVRGKFRVRAEKPDLQ